MLDQKGGQRRSVGPTSLPGLRWLGKPGLSKPQTILAMWNRPIWERLSGQSPSDGEVRRRKERANAAASESSETGTSTRSRTRTASQSSTAARNALSKESDEAEFTAKPLVNIGDALERTREAVSHAVEDTYGDEDDTSAADSDDVPERLQLDAGDTTKRTNTDSTLERGLSPEAVSSEAAASTDSSVLPANRTAAYAVPADEPAPLAGTEGWQRRYSN